MQKRVVTKIGDIFSISINETEKRYIQLVAYDLLQLNSDVIRCFTKTYPLDANPDSETIINDNILFYSHCVIKLGIKLNVLTKVGKNSELGDFSEVLFRNTSDYGRKENEEPISISQNWYVWRIGDKKITPIGKLDGENKKSYVGLIINPLGILELAKGNRYPINYPS